MSVTNVVSDTNVSFDVVGNEAPGHQYLGQLGSEKSAPLDVLSAAKKRRSIRAYKQEVIPHSDIEQILDAVRMAPSPFNIQPWRFVVVEDAATKTKLAEAAYNQRQIHSAPAVIVLYTDMDDAVEHVGEVIHPGYDAATAEGVKNTILSVYPQGNSSTLGLHFGYIALGYLLLAAESLGYQTSPMTGFVAADVKKLLNLSSNAEIAALIAIGRGDEEGFPHHRHELDRILRYV